LTGACRKLQPLTPSIKGQSAALSPAGLSTTHAAPSAPAPTAEGTPSWRINVGVYGNNFLWTMPVESVFCSMHAAAEKHAGLYMSGKAFGSVLSHSPVALP